MDSNHDKGLQRALCYHYTIGQRFEMQVDAMLMHKNVSRFVSKTGKNVLTLQRVLSS